MSPPTVTVRGNYLEPEIELLNRRDLAALQLTRLQAVVALAAVRSDLYRGLWNGVSSIRSIEEFQESIPLLDKRALVEHRDTTGDPFAGLLCGDVPEISTIGTTSGTTAEPMPLVEHLCGRPPFHTTVRDMWAAGLRPGDRVVPVGAVQRGPQERVYQTLGCVPLMLNMRPGTDWVEVFDAFDVHRPAHIYLLGGTVAELDRLGDDIDLRSKFSCLKFAVFSGEPLGARMKRKMVEDWGLELYSVAGAADTGAAWDCPMHDGYHLWEDHVFAEAIDPESGALVAEGEVGELVCTTLTNHVWPLIRHKSGDLVRLDKSPCGCGRTHMRYLLIGRVSDRLKIAGCSFVPADVWLAIEQHDETQTGVFQIVYPAADDRLHIRIGYADRRTRSVADLERRLSRSIHDATGLLPALSLIPESELLASSPSGIKLPRVVPA